MGKVSAPGRGVRMASQIEPVVAGVAEALAGGERAGHVVEAGGLGGADAEAGGLGREGERDAGAEAAAAAADEDVGRGSRLPRRPGRRSRGRWFPGRR